LAQDDTGIGRVLDRIARDPDHGPIVLPTTSASTDVRLVRELAAKHRISAIWRGEVTIGADRGPSRRDFAERCQQVDRWMQGLAFSARRNFAFRSGRSGISSV